MGGSPARVILSDTNNMMFTYAVCKEVKIDKSREADDEGPDFDPEINRQATEQENRHCHDISDNHVHIVLGIRFVEASDVCDEMKEDLSSAFVIIKLHEPIISVSSVIDARHWGWMIMKILRNYTYSSTVSV